MHQVKMEYVEVRSLFLIAFTFIEILKIGSQILKILIDRISSNSETLRKKDIYYATSNLKSPQNNCQAITIARYHILRYSFD